MTVKIGLAAHHGLPAISLPTAPGHPYHLTAHTTHHTWTVATGIGTGHLLQICDPAAPPSIPTTYHLNGAPIGAVTRRSAGPRYLTDTHGRAPARFLWQGPDQLDHAPRVALFQPIAATTPTARYALTPGPTTGKLTARTTGPDTHAMRTLAGATGYRDHRRPSILIYDPTTDTIPAPSTAPVRYIHITSIAEQTTRRADTSERTWEIVYTITPHPTQTAAPLLTWGEAEKAGITWGHPGTIATITHHTAGLN